MGTNVFAVVGRVTGICSVRESEAAARATVARFNADPFVEPGTPDPDAPYSVEVTTIDQIEATTGQRWGVTPTRLADFHTPAEIALSNVQASERRLAAALAAVKALDNKDDRQFFAGSSAAGLDDAESAISRALATCRMLVDQLEAQ